MARGTEVHHSLGRFPSGQRGQTVNLLAFAFEGSNPSLPTTGCPRFFLGQPFFVGGDMDQGMLSRPHRFVCVRCNQCCSGQPGYVWLSQKDLEALSNYLHVSKRTFALEYCRPVNIGIILTLSLKEKKNHDCIFLGRDGCMVYEARPAQCRTYPFWESVLEDEQRWTEEGNACPGIGQGAIVSSETILNAILERRQNPPLSIGDVAELKGLEAEWGAP